MTVQDVERPVEAPTPGGSARPLLIGLGVAVAVLSVIAGTLSLVGSIARDSLHRSASYAGVRVVDVDVAAESVEVVEGTDSTTQLDRTISWSLSRPTTSEGLEGDRLVVRSTCRFSFGRGCSGRVRLVVPPGAEVRVHSSAGGIEVAGLTGVLNLSSSAGSVDGRELKSTSVTAESSAGSVDLGFAVAPSEVAATSSAGSVDVVLPRGSEAYRVSATSSAGSSDIEVRTDPTSARVVDVDSSAGSVSVTYPR